MLAENVIRDCTHLFQGVFGNSLSNNEESDYVQSVERMYVFFSSNQINFNFLVCDFFIICLVSDTLIVFYY